MYRDLWLAWEPVEDTAQVNAMMVLFKRGLRPATAAACGNVLSKHVLWPHPTLNESEALGVGPAASVSKTPWGLMYGKPVLRGAEVTWDLLLFQAVCLFKLPLVKLP